MTEYCFASVDDELKYTGLVLYVRSLSEKKARTQLQFQYASTKFKLMNAYKLES